jgi:transcription initiation factor TFIID subunit 6
VLLPRLLFWMFLWCLPALYVDFMQLLYGYNSRDPLRFAKVQATRDLFYVEDRELEIETIINECRLPSAPRQVTFKCHWLAIEGVQPDIPQNPPKPASKPGVQDDGDASTGENAGQGTQSSLTRMTDEAEVKPAVRHVLTKEQQVFFEKICSAVLGADVNGFHAAINSLRTDKGLHQLMPYFCKFITEKVSDCTQKFNLKVLVAMMKMVEALLMNSEVHVDHYVRSSS